MPQRPNVVLCPDFQSPAVKARLDIVLLFAALLRPLVPELSMATDQEGKPKWHDIVDVLAERIASQVLKVTRLDDAKLIWNQFLNDLSIASLGPRSAAVLEQMGQELTRRMQPFDPLSSERYLDEMNRAAARRVAEIETQRLHKSQAETAPVPVRVQYDPKGEQYHAQAERGTAEIRWSLQPAEYTLWAALVVDRVLEHEYFCHLLPVNTHLAMEVREGFLHGVLQYQHTVQAIAGTPIAYAEGKWNYALEKFWDKLRRHFEGEVDENHWKLRNLAQSPWGVKKDYWRLVKYVLEVEVGAEEAHRIKSELLNCADRVV